MFKFKLIKGGCEVLHENGMSCGELLIKEDGYYDWWPPFPSTGGCWPSYALKEIVNKLDELNAPYEKQIEEYFSGEYISEL